MPALNEGLEYALTQYEKMVQQVAERGKRWADAVRAGASNADQLREDWSHAYGVLGQAFQAVRSAQDGEISLPDGCFVREEADGRWHAYITQDGQEKDIAQVSTRREAVAAIQGTAR